MLPTADTTRSRCSRGRRGAWRKQSGKAWWVWTLQLIPTCVAGYQPFQITADFAETPDLVKVVSEAAAASSILGGFLRDMQSWEDGRELLHVLKLLTHEASVEPCGRIHTA